MYLGIELGSTRIKSVLINEKAETIAIGIQAWENKLENGIWTYDLEDVWHGLQSSYSNLVKNHGKPITSLNAIGISAMMHGYLPFDKHGKQLSPFRTWRNTNTEKSAKLLTELFDFNIPLRWSIAHLHESIEHTKDIAMINTLAGYVHYMLTGEFVIGIGDASGMFPIDSKILTYDNLMIEKYNKLAAISLIDILPKVKAAGQYAGKLTKDGARLLDTSGNLQPGIPFCPPEGDCGTGMVATNSIAPLTGNVSAGTSIFAMMVLEKPLLKRHKEIDIITTPTGLPTAMVHCNNCTSDIDAYIRLFHEIICKFAPNTDISTVYKMLFNEALKGEVDTGGLMAISYISGEHNTGFHEGRPLLVRQPNSVFNIANLMKTLLLSSMSTLKLGLDILAEKENVKPELLVGHGGLFAVKDTAAPLMADLFLVPVSVMETANEGGAWGIAVLAAYMDNNNLPLHKYLGTLPFKSKISMPTGNDYSEFSKRFLQALNIEKTAVECL